MHKISVKGILRKMESRLNDPVLYDMPVGDQRVQMNELLDQTITINFLDEIYCIRCGRKTSKSFFQGFCFPCFRDAPETAPCIIHPEKCRAHEGVARDMKWAAQNCLQPHVVYLALTSGLKVGVTRESQIPTRWIDQGAVQAVQIARTPNRFLAGEIEVFLKKYYNDKTQWQQLLNKKTLPAVNLDEEKMRAIELLPEEFRIYSTPNLNINYINYPFKPAENKYKSVNFEKTATVSAKLTGIKGQYLLFDNNLALNIRRHGGYLVDVIFERKNY